MSETVPTTRAALAEALKLSAEILTNIELGEIPLTNIALKTSRLARLLNDFDYQKIMAFEAGGYSTGDNGKTVTQDVWRLGVQAGRNFQWTDPKTNKTDDRIYSESLAQLEADIQLSESSLAAARDPAVAAEEPKNSWGFTLKGNVIERNFIRQSAKNAFQRLASRRTMIYEYAMQKHYELRFSGIADDIFTRIRERVDAKIGTVIPDSIQKFSAVYENLQSENPEDWSNAVHGCRRILQDLADAVFPPTDEVRT